MDRRLLLFALLLALCADSTATAVENDRRPNIILILADDLGWADLGCYGSTFHETPNLDRLARRGMRFTQGYAACPVCSPTRASILTGRYPARLHLTDWLPGRSDRPSQKLLRPPIRQQLPLEEITIAEALRPRGYVSASIGKWHLGGEPFWPEHQGFDLNRGGTQTGSPPGGYFRFQTPSLSARDDQEYLTDRLTEEAERFIEQNQDRPFFLYLPHYAVHIPLQAKPDLVARFRAKPATGGPQNNPIYAAMLWSLDEGVGRILKKLDDLKLTDRTVVIFTSDNGGLSVKEGPNTPATSNAPLRAGKGYLYEGGIREPWLIAWPGTIAPGSVCEVPVGSIDLYPTILAMAGAQPTPNQVIDGQSLMPLLTGSGDFRREALYWHYPHYSNQGGRPGGAIREGDHKLIEFYEDGHVELYNLKDDPGEQHDLAAQKPELATRLRQRLAAWRESVDAQMMTPNPDYRPTP
ncbi:MAG: sulfatase [Isosphaeraceae bacterium]|nr:sulfatase [Isosphaeraceae bacterium]